MSRNPRRHPIHHQPGLRALATFLSALALGSIAIPAMADQPQAPKKTQQQARASERPIIAKIESDGLGDGFSVIRDQAGNRIGTMQDDGVTGRTVVYDKRGQRVGVIDREPDFSTEEAEEKEPD